MGVGGRGGALKQEWEEDVDHLGCGQRTADGGRQQQGHSFSKCQGPHLLFWGPGRASWGPRSRNIAPIFKR